MTGIICAMQIEADGIIALSQNTQTEEIAGMKFTTGTLNGKDIAVVVCGVGKVNAAMCAVVLIEKFNPDVVINSGVGGSLSPLVSIGDIVVATKSVHGDKQGEVSFPDGTKIFFDCDKTVVEKLTQACKTLPDTKVEQGVIASGDIFISDRKKRKRIADTFGALVCEMEGAAIGYVCYALKTPYGIIRAISDDLDENKGVDYAKFCELASKKTVGAICEYLKNE